MKKLALALLALAILPASARALPCDLSRHSDAIFEGFRNQITQGALEGFSGAGIALPSGLRYLRVIGAWGTSTDGISFIVLGAAKDAAGEEYSIAGRNEEAGWEYLFHFGGEEMPDGCYAAPRQNSHIRLTRTRDGKEISRFMTAPFKVSE